MGAFDLHKLCVKKQCAPGIHNEINEIDIASSCIANQNDVQAVHDGTVKGAERLPPFFRAWEMNLSFRHSLS